MEERREMKVEVQVESTYNNKDTTAELALRLLDNPIDRHLIDVEYGKNGGSEDVQNGLCELFAGACTIGCAGREDVRGDEYGHNAHGRPTGDRSQRRS